MKQIPFGANGGKPPRPPFWQPWGGGGFLWRALLFLLLTAGVIILVSILPRCGETRDTPGLAQDNPGTELINNIPDPGPDLPDPANNRLEPIDPGNINTDTIDGRQYSNDRVNIMLDSDAGDDTFRRFAGAFKRNYPGEEYKVNYYDPLTKLMQVRVPSGTVAEMIEEMPEKITEVRFLPFPEGLMEVNSRPNDPSFNDRNHNWYFKPIEAESAWEITMGSPDVVVAVVDSFFDLNHEDLKSDRIVSPYSVARRDRNVAPDGTRDPRLPAELATLHESHGTAVAAVATGNGNNGKGSIGIAPKCKLMPVSLGATLSSMKLLQGLLYAIYQGADVINISAGASFGQQARLIPVEQQIALADETGKPEQAVWDYAFDIADRRNITIVWAAGNDDVFTALDPSKRGKNTIKVSAVNQQMKKSEFSDFGNFPDRNIFESTLSAPGQAIYTAVPSNRYSDMDGTSFSAPIVTGAVALMKSRKKNLSNTEIITILKETATPASGTNTIGPVIKIRKALDRI